jgi:hypothetical protein
MDRMDNVQHRRDGNTNFLTVTLKERDRIRKRASTGEKNMKLELKGADMMVCIRFISLRTKSRLLSKIMKICISQMGWRLLITDQRVSYSQQEIRLHRVHCAVRKSQIDMVYIQCINQINTMTIQTNAQ